jgi:glutamine---fructose-6-phosphate transaminase (isomerizing)
VLSAMAGHVFGYEAALAIDGLARPLRQARAAVEAVTAEAGLRDGDLLMRRLAPEIEPLARRWFDGLRVGSYDGQLGASTAVRLSALFRCLLGALPLDAYGLEGGRVATPAAVIEDFTAALTVAIEELTRPVDAIKHQAKTVTVGISRTDETLLEVPLVREVLATGAGRDQFSYRTLRTLAEISPAVADVVGFTRYRIDGDTIAVVDRGGIARDLPSRTERDPQLRGTKHRVATEREVLVARGRRDGRTLVIVPEVKDGQATGITLLHVRFADRLPVATARGVLQGYRNRYAVLRDAVQETEPTFREDLLAGIPVAELLTEPISHLADRWHSG